MLRHSAQRSGLALTQVSPRELRHQPMQTTHIVYKFQQMHNKKIYYNYVAVNRLVADLTKPMDETDTARRGRASGAAQRRRLDRSTKSFSATHELRGRLCPVRVSAMGDVYDRDYASFFIDPIDHPVGTAASAEPVIHRGEQPLTNPVGIGE
jgi:hypothetical protein